MNSIARPPAGPVSGPDGTGWCPGVGAVRPRSSRSIPRPVAGSPAGGAGAHAAPLLSAALVQPVRSGGGRGPLRVDLDAPVRGHRPGPREPVPDETTVCKFRHLLEQQLIWAVPCFRGIGRICGQGMTSVQPRHHCRRYHHSAPRSTKKARKARDPARCTRPRRATMVLRHEGPYRRSMPEQADTTGGRHPRPTCTTSTPCHSCCTGRKPACLARFGLQRAGRSDPSGRAPRSGFSTNKRAYRNRPLSSQREEQARNHTKSKVRARGRASLLGDQMHLRLRQGALPGAYQERQPAVCDLRTGQSVPGAWASCWREPSGRVSE